MSDTPATCQPPDASVSGSYYLSYDNGTKQTIKRWRAEPVVLRGWLDELGSIHAQEAWRIGYRILGPVPTHSEVEALRAELHTEQLTVMRMQNAGVALQTELTAARTRNAKLEAVLKDIAKQKTTEEMSYADGMNADFEGACDYFIERARMALEP